MISTAIDLDSMRFDLWKSLLDFIKVFYFEKNGRHFIVPDTVGRQSHYITVSIELQNVFDGKCTRLIINIPPGHGKSTMLVYFVAWAMSQYPDSQIMYISYSAHLAEKHTGTIKEIMELPLYRKMFGIYISKNSSARGNFATTAGGRVMAFGSSGSITGMDAGLPYVDRFSGMAIIDDAHKPDEVTSDTLRASVIKGYQETIQPRPRSPTVPIVFLGQRLHEDDLPNFLLEGRDGQDWRRVVLKGIDDAGNALCPSIKTLDELRSFEQFSPYMFASQYQQDPQPAGGGIFKPDWFVLTDEEPKIVKTFITADTAETDKNYNDATVFSFWGLYKIVQRGVETDLWGLHWLDCLELRVEPHQLEGEFFQFYAACMRHKIKPDLIAVEKKSTGTTLVSTLKTIQGLRELAVDRSGIANNKTARFLSIQPYIAKKHVSLPRYGKHTQLCIEHCRKITVNNTHRFDDICDTLYDAVKIGLIDNTLISRDNTKSDAVMNSLLQRQRMIQNLNIDRNR